MRYGLVGTVVWVGIGISGLLQSVHAGSVPDMLDATLPGAVTIAIMKEGPYSTPLGFGSATEVAYRKALDLTGSESSGSGFLVDMEGKKYIVTNVHVVEQAASMPGSIVAYSIERKAYRMHVIGGDSFYDIAVLGFLDPPGPELHALKLRRALPRIGEHVYVIGNPEGKFPYSVTEGIVSGKNRSHNVYHHGYLQISASAFPGNSGGPVVDEEGVVVGVLSWGLGDVLNFAVESPLVLRVVSDVVTNNGRVKRAYLGIRVLQEFGKVCDRAFPDDEEPKCVFRETTGPVIGSVMPDSPAAKVSGMEGATIRQIGNTEVQTLQEVLAALENLKPADEVSLRFERNNTTKSVTVRAGELTTGVLATIGKNALESHIPIRISGKVDGRDGVKFDLANNKMKVKKSTNRKKGFQKQDTASGHGNILGVGEAERGGKVWKVENLADLGAAVRNRAISGIVDVIVQSGDEVEALRVDLSDNEDTLAKTLYY